MSILPPLVLISTRDEWTTRSLESVLVPAGYAIVRAYTGDRVIERAATAQPDLVLLGWELPDETGISACQRLREGSIVSPSTPILLLSVAPPSRTDRTRALEAGAWDVIPFPVDPAELRARIKVYSDAKLDAVSARDAGFLDEETGMYNLRGLLHRSSEVAALARRAERPLACVVFRSRRTLGGESIASSLDKLASALRETGRRSDVFGRLDDAHVAVLATDTDAEGALGLVRRISRAVGEDDVRVGIYAVADPSSAPTDPGKIIAEATRAIDA